MHDGIIPLPPSCRLRIGRGPGRRWSIDVVGGDRITIEGPTAAHAEAFARTLADQYRAAGAEVWIGCLGPRQRRLSRTHTERVIPPA